ncbi:hypothetical protein AUP68_10286 [Ilyonectria robusta]
MVWVSKPTPGEPAVYAASRAALLDSALRIECSFAAETGKFRPCSSGSPVDRTGVSVAADSTKQDTGHSLCLSLLKPPDLVIPKNRPLEAKKNTQNLLNSILALAKATTLTAYFSDKETDQGTRQQLASVASVFSKHRDNRLLVNKERANLTTLYAGIGGQIFDLNPKPSSEVAPPPSYNKVAPSSRQPHGKHNTFTTRSTD